MDNFFTSLPQVFALGAAPGDGSCGLQGEYQGMEYKGMVPWVGENPRDLFRINELGWRNVHQC